MKLPIHSPNLTTTSEALRRIFLPTLLLHPHPSRYRSSFPTARFTPPNPQPQAPRPGNSNDEDRPRDEAIRAREIQVVSEDNSLTPPTTVRAVLASIDRMTHFLLQVGTKPHPHHTPHFPPAPTAQKSSSSSNNSDGPQIPVCKIISKKAFRLAQTAKTSAQTQAKKKAAGVGSKEVELNWNIAENDLRIRLERLRAFLREGRRVEVVFGRKRKGWMRRGSVEEGKAEAVVRTLVGGVEGEGCGREWKGREGEVGGEMRMFFEGVKEKG
ncbi:MAG: hypothetical protein Q9220_005269 [cf. Caloplaca sp. 1 TL-2023]